ncbi:MAG: class I SAM-dependent methyltransferase [Pyrinomonadaceae bacterium]
MLVKVVENCANCGSASFATWSATIDRSHLHFSQSQCGKCGLVFSNPQCDPSAVRDYYAHHYYEDHWPKLLKGDEESISSAVARLKKEREHIKRVIKSGKVLEVGSGTGLFLRLMQEAGFDPYGVELSQTAVDYSRSISGLSNIVQGTLEQASYLPESFDVVYAWHVIEHVLDLDAFVRELHRVLQPDGILWIGTENYRNASHYLTKLLKLIRGLPPPFATSSEHTFVFTPQTLSDVLVRRGFEVLLCETYQPSWHEKLETMHFRSALSRGYFMSQHIVNYLCRTGPLMRLVARK